MSNYTESSDELEAGDRVDSGRPPWFDAASLLHEIREDVRRLLAERPHDDELRHRVDRTYWELRKHLHELGADELIDALGDPFASRQLDISASSSALSRPWQVAASCG
jgi:predicted component of type VI protein secretion system